jgi:hypothetical protein
MSSISKSYADYWLTTFALSKTVNESRDSVVGIATGYGLDDLRVGVRALVRVNNFNFSISSKPALRSTQPPVQWVPGSLSGDKAAEA